MVRRKGGVGIGVDGKTRPEERGIKVSGGAGGGSGGLKGGSRERERGGGRRHPEWVREVLFKERGWGLSRPRRRRIVDCGFSQPNGILLAQIISLFFGATFPSSEE